MPETQLLDKQAGLSFHDVDVVLVDDEIFEEFLDHSLDEYCQGRASVHSPDGTLHRPNSFGLLGGIMEGDALLVKQFAFATNVRAVDPVPLQEFKDNIVPQFGKQYDDGERGFWCDSRDVLKVMRQFDEAGLELIGSIHMHPDWHRIGPAHERGIQGLSENPSRMDEYLFRNAGWPLNIICYLETRDEGITHTYAAWRPPRFDDVSGNAQKMTMRFF
jgi:hypothetical protein